MDNKLKIIGKIDLNSIPGHELVPAEGNLFRIHSMMVSFWGQEPVLMSFDIKTKEEINDYRSFSLLIGRNGVGKSSLLREIIDFFVFAYNGDNFRYNYRYILNKPVRITAIKYVLNKTEYNIERGKKTFEYYRNQLLVRKNDMKFPLIIALTMGMFDKFPYQNNGKGKESVYDVPIYKYIGPKAKSNIFSSKSYLMMQMLAGLSNVKRRAQLTMIARVLKFIGYEERIQLEYKVKDTLNATTEKKVELLSSDAKFFYENSYQNNLLDDNEEVIDFNRITITSIKKMRLSEVNELRQNGLLSKCKCFLYKHGEKLQCDQLSSGEFNMLSIVMNVVVTANNKNLLILLDEPEISQHPNWQVDIIGNLDTALNGYNCHFLIATHSHFLVSNLPQDRSNVIDIERSDNKVEISSLECNTLGWSAEEVLLKVFKMSTDRNRYLAEIVGTLLSDIAQKTISLQDAEKKVKFIKMVSGNLTDVDPMKKIILSIVSEFENHGCN